MTNKNENILIAPIWLNSNIKIGCRSALYRAWYNSGVKIIGDIMDHNYAFISKAEIEMKFNLKNICELRYQSLCSAIRHMINTYIVDRNTINHIIFPYIPVSAQLLLKSEKGCRDFYCITRSKPSPPPNERKWQTKLELIITNWKSVYNNCFKITTDSTLQWFQYRLIHRILPVKVYLKKIGVFQEDSCSLCGEEGEDIQHLLYYCNKSRAIWNDLDNFIFRKTSNVVSFNIQNILFGELSNKFSPLNFIILVTKYYSYSSAKKNQPVHIFALQYYLKDRFLIEKFIACTNLQTVKFEKKWSIWKEFFNSN
jgi:hypothetical protein